MLDSNDFPTRFFAHAKGTHTLGPEGGLLAMLLVVWATSFGFDEKGMPDNESLDERPSTSASISSRNSRRASVHAHESSGDGGRKRRREKTDAMIREILELIDYHGIMRRPTWDGVCVLLLILPLIEGAKLRSDLQIDPGFDSLLQRLIPLRGWLCTTLQSLSLKLYVHSLPRHRQPSMACRAPLTMP